MANTFNLSDIKAGYLLRVKDTKANREFNMTVIPAKKAAPEAILFSELTGSTVPKEDGELACVNPGVLWWPIKYFNEDLVTREGIFKVMAVYGYATVADMMANKTRGRELLWERTVTEKTEEEKAAPDQTDMAEFSKFLDLFRELIEG